MDLSETILAAMIGAIATVTTALFQIFTAFKARGKVDTKPRRGSTMRSVLAVLALMIASAVGGFLYSELLKQRDGEDIRAMRHELRELRDLTASTLDERNRQSLTTSAAQLPGGDLAAAIPVSLESTATQVESVVYVPACRRPAVAGTDALAGCDESDAQRIALCGTIPADASVQQLQLFAQPDAVQEPWAQHAAVLEADVGGARFTGRTFEYAQGDAQKAVCVNFLHWSSQHPYIARFVIQYGFEQAEAEVPVVVPAAETVPSVLQTAVTAGSSESDGQTAAFAAQAVTQ